MQEPKKLNSYIKLVLKNEFEPSLHDGLISKTFRIIRSVHTPEGDIHDIETNMFLCVDGIQGVFPNDNTLAHFISELEKTAHLSYRLNEANAIVCSITKVEVKGSMCPDYKYTIKPVRGPEIVV